MVVRRLVVICIFTVWINTVRAAQNESLHFNTSNNTSASSRVNFLRETNSSAHSVEPQHPREQEVKEKVDSSHEKLTSHQPSSNLASKLIRNEVLRAGTHREGCTETGCVTPVTSSVVENHRIASSLELAVVGNGTDHAHFSPPPTPLGYISAVPPSSHSNSSSNASENLIPVEPSQSRKESLESRIHDPKHHETPPPTTEKEVKVEAPDEAGHHPLTTTKTAIESVDPTESDKHQNGFPKEETVFRTSIAHITRKTIPEEIIHVSEKPLNIDKKLATPAREIPTLSTPKSNITTNVLTFAEPLVTPYNNETENVISEIGSTAVVDEDNYVGPLTPRPATTQQNIPRTTTTTPQQNNPHTTTTAPQQNNPHTTTTAPQQNILPQSSNPAPQSIPISTTIKKNISLPSSTTHPIIPPQSILPPQITPPPPSNTVQPETSRTTTKKASETKRRSSTRLRVTTTTAVPTPKSPEPTAFGTEAPPRPPRLLNPSCAHLPVCVKVLVESRFPLCDENGRQDFSSMVSQIMSKFAKSPTSPNQVVLELVCGESEHEVSHGSHVVSSFVFYIMDTSGDYDESLTAVAGALLKKTSKKQQLSGTSLSHSRVLKSELIERDDDGAEIHKVGVQAPPPLSAHSGMIAAIVISAVAGTCLCLLCLLLVVMKQRLAAQTNDRVTTQRVNGGPPAELDAYSLDSFSINASFRRRRPNRLSVNSFLNRGFEGDEDIKELPSRRMSASTLATCLRQRRSRIEDEFQRIPMNMPKPDEIPPGAEVKNRYANVIPNSRTRVLLTTEKADDPAKSYINANYVQGYDGRPGFYIACQAPLNDFVSDFWKMVWEQQSRVILMLTLLEENGVSRCAPYFPESTLNCRQLHGDYQVSLLKKDVREFYTLSTLRLYDVGKNLFREVIHLWYTAWPVVGVPTDHTSLVIYLQQARPYLNCNSGPTIVHCSAGSGRTGTVIALDMCMREYEESRVIDVVRAVSRIRRDKGGAVQNKDQYLLIHEAMLEYASIVANQSSRPSIQSNTELNSKRN